MKRIHIHIIKIKESLAFLLSILVISLYSGFALSQNIPSGQQTQLNISGTPFIQNWSYEQYGNAHSQNWAIVQDERGVMYFGNGYGILEYDGVNWRLIKFPNRSTCNSLAMGEKGRIFVGGGNEFGYLSSDNSGELKYVSLMRYLPEQFTDFSNVWETLVTPNGIYFISSRYIFRWDQHAEAESPENMQVIVPETSLDYAFMVNDKVYVKQAESGLMELADNEFHLVPGGEIFSDKRIYSIISFDAGNLLFSTRKAGMFIFDGKTFKPFKTDADDYFLKNRALNGAVLPDGTFAFGTQQGGVVIIDPKGRVRTIINENSGLINNHVRNLYTDNKGGLWLSLNYGISRVEIPSPFSRFGESFGIKGYIEDIIWQYERLYVATSLGVYYLPLNTHTNQLPFFHKVSDVPPKAWYFLVFENKFLVATGDGVYHIRKNGEAQLLTHSFSSLLYQSKKYPDRIYVALSEGISILQYKNGQWYSTGQLTGTFGAIRTMIEDKDGALWLGTEQNGVQRIIFQEPNPQNSMDESIPDFEIDNYGQKDGIVPDDVDIFYYRNQIHFAALKGLWRFDAKSNRFLHDLSLGSVVGDTSRWIGRTVEDENGWLWLENGDDEGGDVGVLIPQDDGTFLLKTSPFEKISKLDIWLIFPDPKFKGTVWFGGEQGLLKYNASIVNKNDIAYNALIRSVIVYPKSGKDSVIFGGTQMANEGKKFTNPILPYADNSMRFEYAAVSYSDPEVIRYQHFLEGFDENWSGWTSELMKDYTNLSEGEYTFKVRSINLYQVISREAVYSFKILPPWWRTWWAYSIYGILILGLLKGIDIFQRKRLIEREQLKAKEKELKQANKIKKAYKELKATQSQLIQSEKMASLGELTAGIAHEIQNPLNFVNNFSEVSNELIDEMNEEIEKGDLDEAKAIAADVKQNLEKITHHGKRAEAIVKGMLQHSRSSSGVKEPTDINALADEYFRLAYHGLRAKNKSFNATMESNYDESIGEINIIPQDIGRVILNLITNAFYAVSSKALENKDSSYKPTVSVRTKKNGNVVEVSVTDNGAGIPDSIKDKIFEPFFSTKPTGQGTGLGLSMSYEIITKGHGGKLKVETLPDGEAGKEGKGTTFTIQLTNLST